MNTWQDIERAAINCPVLHRAVTHVHRGDCTREEALIGAALHLSNALRGAVGKYAEELMQRPASFEVCPKANQ